MNKSQISVVWKRFKKNKRAIFGIWVLSVAYLLAGFSFVNTWMDYKWLPDPNDARIGEKFYKVEFVSTPTGVIFQNHTLENVTNSESVSNSESVTRILDKFPQLKEAFFLKKKILIEDKSEIPKLEKYLREEGIKDATPLDLYKKTYYVKYGDNIYKISIINIENQPPSLSHPFGTDDFGRDVLSRVIYASRVSLSIGFVAVAIALTIGIFMGSISGYYGGFIDQIIMRLVDIWMSIPALILLIAMVAVFGPGLFKAMILIGILSWAGIARIVRGQFLSLREQGFIEAAKSVGANDFKIIFKHILPNAMAPIIVNATLFLADVILLEAGLSFLGLGAQPPTASWGNMLTDAQKYLRTAWWIAVFPGLAIFLTVISFNFVGDGLRDALDPRMNYPVQN
ncbi:MAG: ABC transporter permease [Methanosarcinales archaeon]